MFRLQGVIPPMITPFDEQGNLDTRALEKLVEFLSTRVQGLFICGSYGSGPMMSIQERKTVAEITKRIIGDAIPIIVHTGSTNNRDTVELSVHARSIGCAAVAAVGPFYFHHTEDTILEFYSGILKAVGKEFPVYVYNNPRFQGYDFSLSTMSKLKEVGVHGIKDATFDILTFSNYMRLLASDTFDIALGTESMWLSACVLGCQAYIPGIGNVFPELCVKMWREGMDKDYATCRQTQFLVNKIRDIMYLAQSTQLAVYAMARIRGIVDAYPRAPFMAASNEQVKAIRQSLERAGVL
jgi:dihydrodipicolinate synthase/N-acetylneuraminate lyase